MIYDPNANKFVELALNTFYSCELIAGMEDNGKKPVVSEDYKKMKKYMNADSFREAKTYINSLNSLFEECKTLINRTKSKEWYLALRDYIYFIKVCEKAFMYNNDNDEDIYCEIVEFKDIFTIIANTNDYKIKISFQDSSINMPGVNIDMTNDDDPLDFMREKEQDKSNKVLFINIDITRNFGVGMNQSFRFIYNSGNNIDDQIDILLLNVIENIVSEMIYKQFVYILSNTIISKSKILHSQWCTDVCKQLVFLEG